MTRMFVPPVIKQRIWGKGALLTLPALALMTGITVWALRWWGLAALTAALLLGALAELWRESLATTAQLDEAQAALASERIAREEAEAQSERHQGQNRVLGRSVVGLEAENAKLKAAAEAPQLGLGHLLYAVGAQVDEIAIVQRHRTLGGELGSTDWPVTSITQTDGYLQVVAHVDHEGERLGGEPICLVDKTISRALATSIVRTSGPNRLEARFELEGVSAVMRRRLGTREPIEPDQFIVRLAGHSPASPLAKLKDSQLDELASALQQLAKTVSSVLAPPATAKREIEEEA